MKIGVISDTHGYLDPRVMELFAGVDHILHAGDIGQSMVVAELEKVAPVTAVLGNVDGGLPYRDTELVTLGGYKFLLHHIVNPHSLSATFESRLERAQPDVVVFGHTHEPFAQRFGRTLFFNPGYAGKQRFLLSRSVGVLQCEAKAIIHEWRLL